MRRGRGRPPKRLEDRAARMVSLRLTEDEWVIFRDAAQDAGESLSEWLRNAARAWRAPIGAHSAALDSHRSHNPSDSAETVRGEKGEVER